MDETKEPQEVVAPQPQPAKQVKVTKSAVDNGIVQLNRYLDKNPYKFSDNVGAQFFIEMFKASPEKTREFYERFSIDGFKLKLNEFEQQALDKAAARTTPDSLMKDITPRDALQKAFNRRAMMRIGTIGVAAAFLKFGKDAAIRTTSEMAAESGMGDLQKKMQDVKTTEEADKLKEQMKEALQKNEFYQFMQGVGAHIKAWLPVYAGSMILLAEVGSRVAGVFQEIGKKKEQLVTNLDEFANFKLGRTAVVAGEQQGNAR